MDFSSSCECGVRIQQCVEGYKIVPIHQCFPPIVLSRAHSNVRIPSGSLANVCSYPAILRVAATAAAFVALCTYATTGPSSILRRVERKLCKPASASLSLSIPVFNSTSRCQTTTKTIQVQYEQIEPSAVIYPGLSHQARHRRRRQSCRACALAWLRPLRSDHEPDLRRHALHAICSDIRSLPPSRTPAQTPAPQVYSERDSQDGRSRPRPCPDPSRRTRAFRQGDGQALGEGLGRAPSRVAVGLD
ncbi:hypothetical protein C8Q80DRAFT_1167075 [Daedaleopsis nitida]|nr:hypothetical protein C8Q80DRAFT_1167075 [Daedaleopsis nitida]